jgi:hypothetical protein
MTATVEGHEAGCNSERQFEVKNVDDAYSKELYIEMKGKGQQRVLEIHLLRRKALSKLRID